MSKDIENVINVVLTDEAQKNAFDFFKFLQVNDMEFERGRGYWEDKP